MSAASNPRAIIGHNKPPENALELVKPSIDALSAFLAANPVIGNDDEARGAKGILDSAVAALKRVDDERRSKVDPLNAEVKAVNAAYHRFHNSDRKRPGEWDKLVIELLSRLNTFAKQEERKRFEAEQKARREAEEAAEAAKRAAEAEEQAKEMAAAGVCDIDMAEVIEEAHATSQMAKRADWTARRAEGQTKVRIAGGSGRAISLQDHETLTVVDWQAAISEMGLTRDIADAILKSARAYRKLTDALPSGIEATFERGL